VSACWICLDLGAPDPPLASYHERCLERLLDVPHAPHIDLDRATLPLATERVVGKFSISGVQPKAQVHLSADRTALEVVAQAGTHILKPQINRFPWVPENEHLSMALARLVGINVPDNGLFMLSDRSVAYVIRRFDRTSENPPRKRRQEDFCQLSQRRVEDKYNGSAEECAKLIYRYASHPEIGARQLFRQMLLSYWIGNGDLHLKNLSLVEADDGTFQLSPAYDLLSTWLYGDSALSLPVSGKKKNINRKNWLKYAEAHCQIPRPEAESIMAEMLACRDAALALVERSALPEASIKQGYQELLEERWRALDGGKARA
jgi:serine/threonine-protein kinase HipA